jgi:hypothetical protein
MAILNFTGFETSDFTECWASSGTVSVQSSVVRTGAYALRSNPSTAGATGYVKLGGFTNEGTNTPLNVATLYVRFYLRVASNGQDSTLLLSDAVSGAGRKFRLDLTSSQTLALYNKDDTLLDTGASTLSSNTWYQVDVMVGTGASANYEIKLNGSSLVSGTGDFRSGNHDYIHLGFPVANGTPTFDAYFDDVVLNDSTWEGTDVTFLQVDGDGVYNTDWTASAGNRWQCVDELPASSSDYIQTPPFINADYSATLVSTSAAGVSGTVKSVKAYATVRRTTVGSVLYCMLIRSNTTDSVTNTSPAVDAGVRQYVLSTDPDTSSAWTNSAVDAIEVGVRNKVQNLQADALYVFALSESSSPTSFEEDMTGRMYVLGQATTSARATFTSVPVGALYLSGVATTSARATFVATPVGGAVLFSGIATTGGVGSFSGDPVGGAVYLSGLAAPSARVSANPSQVGGQVLFSGLATVAGAGSFYHDPVGTIYLSGVAALRATYVVTSVGGLLRLSGESPDAYAGGAVYTYNARGRLTLIPDRRLVARYAFDDQTGTRVTDSSLYENHGTLEGSAAWASTVKGYGVDFGGVGRVSQSGLEVDTSSGTDAKTTVAFWMYWRGGGTQMPFAFNSYDLFLWGGYFGFNTYNSDLYGINDTGLANTWVHVVAVFNNGSATQCRLYLNGVAQSLSQKTGTPINRTATNNAALGGEIAASGYKLNGIIVDFRLYNGDVTQTDVDRLYAGGAAANPDESAVVRGAVLPAAAGLVALSGTVVSAAGAMTYEGSGRLTFRDPTLLLWLRMDEGTGTTSAYDSSLYGRTGSLANTESGDWVTGCPTIRYPYSSSYALQFDGLDEYITVAADGLTNPNYTITVWVNASSLPSG